LDIDWEKYQQFFETAMQQMYSETVLDHGRNPRNLGDLEETNAFGIVTGSCGDTMAVWLKVEDNRIADISFTTDGCMTSLAAGSMATELAKGKSLTDAQKLSQQEVLDALGGLPEESEHCALLAVDTLKEAIRNYKSIKGES
jgi:nitrogen fixation NifU-like protein